MASAELRLRSCAESPWHISVWVNTGLSTLPGRELTCSQVGVTVWLLLPSSEVSADFHGTTGIWQGTSPGHHCASVISDLSTNSAFF